MSGATPVTRIGDGATGLRHDLAELWRARDLGFLLALRDVRIRYTQAVFGAAWAVLQPLGLMVLFSVFLGRFVRVPSDGVPYALFVLAGLVPWTFVSTAVTSASASMVTNAALVAKVYFPRLLLPVSAASAHLVDIAVSVSLLVGFAVVLGYPPAASILLMPAAIVVAFAAAVGAGIGLAALNVRYRDVKHAIPFVLQLGLFASPVVYPLSLIPERFTTLYALNPMVAVTVVMRTAVLGTPLSAATVLPGLATTALLLAFGLGYFRRVSPTFSDEI